MEKSGNVYKEGEDIPGSAALFRPAPLSRALPWHIPHPPTQTSQPRDRADTSLVRFQQLDSLIQLNLGNEKVWRFEGHSYHSRPMTIAPQSFNRKVIICWRP